MPSIPDVVTRVQVVASSAVTLIVLTAAGFVEFCNAIAPAVPDGWQDNVVSIGGTVAGALAAVVLVLRRVTGVPVALRGLTPPSGALQSTWLDDAGGKYSYVTRAAAPATEAATGTIRLTPSE